MDKKEGPSFNFQDVDFSSISIQEVRLGLDACEAAFETGQFEEAIEFLLRVSEEFTDLVPDMLRLFFGKNAMLKGKKNAGRLYKNILASLSSYHFPETRKMPLEILDFLEHPANGEGLVEPRRVLVQKLLVEHPYYFSAWVQYYKLLNESELEREGAALATEMKGLVGGLLEEMDVAAAATPKASAMDPFAIRNAAFLHVQGNKQYPGMLLMDTFEAVSLEATEDVKFDFAVQLERLLEEGIQNAPALAAKMLTVKNHTTRSLDQLISVDEEWARIITLLRKKYSGVEDSQVVFDEIGSTNITLGRTIDET